MNCSLEFLSGKQSKRNGYTLRALKDLVNSIEKRAGFGAQKIARLNSVL